MNSFELPQKSTNELTEPDYLRRFKKDLQSRIQSEGNPLPGLIQNIRMSEAAGRISKDLAESVIEKFHDLASQSEEEFINDIALITQPILEITKKTEIDNVYNRDMFSSRDIEQAAELIKENGAEKIYVVGNVGSGKTTFSEQLADLTKFKSIDLDRSFKDFKKTNQREAKDIDELLMFVRENNEPPYIINHADLLRQNLVKDADMVVFLNPSKTELLKSREIRTKDGADGEWQNVSTKDYDNIALENMTSLINLGGTEKYNNQKSGTIIHVLNNKKI